MAADDAKSFERTLELGKEIAQDLSDHDLLGRWMAHYLAELIVRAETATGEDRLPLQREAADIILRLWAGRSRAPLQSRPTAAFHSVAETLDRLSEDRPWRFYGLLEEDSEPDEATTQTSLLRLALLLEQMVQEVVRNIIVSAAEEAGDKEARWVRSAAHLTEDPHMRVADLVQQLKQRQLARLDGAPDEPKEEAHDRNADSIATLRKAEARLAAVRVRLEERAAGSGTLEQGTT